MELVIEYRVPVEDENEARTIETELRDGKYNLEDVIVDEAKFTTRIEVK